MAPLSPFGANVDAHTRKLKGELTNETGPRKLEHVTIHEKDKNSTVIEQVTITPIPDDFRSDPRGWEKWAKGTIVEHELTKSSAEY